MRIVRKNPAIIFFIFRGLKLFPKPGNRDVKLLPVFGNRSSGHIVAFIVQNGYKLFVSKRSFLIFDIDTLCQNVFNLSCRDLLPRIGHQPLREEVLKRIDSEMCLNVFTVNHSGDG